MMKPPVTPTPTVVAFCIACRCCWLGPLGVLPPPPDELSGATAGCPSGPGIGVPGSK